jgi:hypothetical protein
MLVAYIRTAGLRRTHTHTHTHTHIYYVCIYIHNIYIYICMYKYICWYMVGCASRISISICLPLCELVLMSTCKWGWASSISSALSYLCSSLSSLSALDTCHIPPYQHPHRPDRSPHTTPHTLQRSIRATYPLSHTPKP